MTTLFDQHQNLQNAIIEKKARIEKIGLSLAQPIPRGHPTGSRHTLIEERLHLEKAVAELEREDLRLQSQNAARIPPPPTVLRGSYIPPKPKLTVPLDGLPPYYPASLTAKTDLLICEAVKRFPVQPQVVEFCKYVLTKLRSHFLQAVKRGDLRQDLALSTMRELLHWLLVYNCDNDSRRFECEQELSRSNEWLKLARGVERVIAGARTRDGRIGGVQRNPLLTPRESVVALLSKELTDLSKRHPIPHYWHGVQGPRTLNESEQEYDGAIHFLQHFPTHWKESAVTRIKEQFGLLIDVGGTEKNPLQWANSKAKEVIEEIFPMDGFVTDRAINVWICNHLQQYMDEAAFEKAKGVVKIAPPATSGNRRQRPSPNAKKELIALLKARHPEAQAPTICKLIDQTIEKEIPIRQGHLAPLEQWKRRVPDERSWVGFYTHAKTHNLVKSYINKVPRLKTSK